MLKARANLRRTISAFTAIILLAFVFLLALTACSGKDNGDSAVAGSTKGTVSEQTTAVVQKPATIKYWRHQTDALEKFSKEMIEGFKSVIPEIKVEFESIGINDYDRKLNIAIASNEAPDLYAIQDVQYGKFSSNKLLAPVDFKAMGYQSLDELLQKRFLPGAMNFAVSDGKLYSPGWTEEANWAIVYNKDCFDKAKVPYPSEDKPMTWDEYFELAKKLTLRDDSGKMIQMGEGMFLSNLDNPDGARFILDPIFRQSGGVCFDENAAGKPLNKDGWLKVARIMYEASLKGKYGYVDTGFPTAINAHTEMFAGRVAMCMGGVWAEGWGKSVNPDIKLGFAPYPQVDATHNASTTGGWLFAINAKSSGDNQTAANKFVEFLTNDANTIKLFDNVGAYVPRNVAGYKEHLIEKQPAMKVFFDDSSRAVGTIYGDKGAEQWTVLKTMAEAIFKMGTSPEEAVNNAWKEMENIK